MNKLLLITRPEHDPTTRYLSRWSKEIIDLANKKGVRVIDLYREKVTRKRTTGILKKSNPDLVILNGHGDDNKIAGHNNEVILDTDNQGVLKSKIVFSRSCKSARVFGPRSISGGALVFIGYDESFIFRYNERCISRPQDDKTAELFLKPSNYVAICLLKGHSAGTANRKSKFLFRKIIEKLLVEGSSQEDYENIRYLFWNMKHQVCLGNENAVFK